jgi:hypothetical protein
MKSKEKGISYTIKRTFHTGFCVGNLDWTIGFFQQMLGFKLIDKVPRDPRNQSFLTGVPDTQVMVAYMDCAGHSLELQDYSGPADRQEYRPRMVDMGHFHISFWLMTWMRWSPHARSMTIASEPCRRIPW